MELLDKKGRIDLTVSDHEADPVFSIDYLFGEARGQMFGVMVYAEKDGRIGSIPAFSGQYNGQWLADGWAPPLFDVSKFHHTTFEVEKEIKKLSRMIENRKMESHAREIVIQQRKLLSRSLMKEIHALYRLNNFKGESASINQAYAGSNGIPTGTGDCCAPKLLQYAAVNRLTPLGIGEFFWGRENRSNTRLHGSFYPSCQEKCAPILGFMLCGLDE